MRRCAALFRKAVCLVAMVTSAAANPILEWNALMIDAIRADNSGPTLSSRNLAILHVAMFDAINSIKDQYQFYAINIDPPAACSAESAAHAAAHEVMNGLYPGLRIRSDQFFESYRAASNQDETFKNGIALGVQVGQQTLKSRQDDGAATEVPYVPSLDPGAWRRTPPFFRPPYAPHWRYLGLFALPNVESFMPPPPPALTSSEYAASLNEVKKLGGRNSSVRTEEQSLIATFWSDFSYTSMPPGHWHLIAESIARERQVDLLESARLFALISLAQADAAIVCWETKYRYNLWRPCTAIQRADEDANSETEKDADWNSYLNCPPFPAYTSGHSAFSAASAQVLADFFQTDHISFTATSDSLPGISRKFKSLSACADEVGMSRIYGGIHYSFDNERGKENGRIIGKFVTQNLLLSHATLPLIQFESATPEQTRFRLHGHLGKTIIFECSTDLKNWSTIHSAVALRGGIPLLHNSTNERCFVRIREGGNG